MDCLLPSFFSVAEPCFSLPESMRALSAENCLSRTFETSISPRGKFARVGVSGHGTRFCDRDSINELGDEFICAGHTPQHTRSMSFLLPGSAFSTENWIPHGSADDEFTTRMQPHLCGNLVCSPRSSCTSNNHGHCFGSDSGMLSYFDEDFPFLDQAPDVGITVDLSTVDRAVQCVKVAAQHCLSELTLDREFAEQAAKLTSFDNGNFGSVNQQRSAFTKCVGTSFQTDPCSITNRISERSRCPLLGTSAIHSSSGAAALLKNLEGAVADFGEHKSDRALEGACLPTHFDSKWADAKICRASSCPPSKQIGNEWHPEHSIHTMKQDKRFMSTDQMKSSIMQLEEKRGKTVHNDSSGKKRKSQSICKPGGESCSMPTAFESEPKATRADVKAKKNKGEHGLQLEKDEAGGKMEQSTSNNSTSKSSCNKRSKVNIKTQEPSKPAFVHVRAKRGQATDSHSLAERVRREKISERMKYLQDLVPGCNRITGKALMLDEIINYVQSLQRQVEFLSLRLAALNPVLLDFNIDDFYTNEILLAPYQAGISNISETQTINQQLHDSLTRRSQLQGSSGSSELQLPYNTAFNHRTNTCIDFGTDIRSQVLWG